MTHSAQHTKDAVDAADRAAADGEPPLESFLNGIAGAMVGVGEGVERAIVGAPGIAGDMAGLVNMLAKEFGWADDVSWFDKLRKGAYGKIPGTDIDLATLASGSEYFIKHAGEALGKVHPSFDFSAVVPQGQSTRQYFRTMAEMGTPVGLGTAPLVKGAGALRRLLSGPQKPGAVSRTPDVPLSAYAGDTPPPVRPVGQPSVQAQGLLDEATPTMRPGVPSIPGPPPKPPFLRGMRPDPYGAGAGAVGGFVHEYTKQHPELGINEVAGGLGGSLIASLLGRGGAQTAGNFIKNRLPEAGSFEMRKAEQLMEAAEEFGIQLSPAEALAAAGDARMNQIFADITAFQDSNKPGALAKKREAEGQLKKALHGFLSGRVAGKNGLEVEGTAAEAARRADEAVVTARERLAAGPAGKLFEEAKDTEVDPDWVAGLGERALAASRDAGPGSKIAQAYKKFADGLQRLDVEFDETGKATVKPVDQLRIGALHDSYRELREALEKQKVGGEVVPQQRLSALQQELEGGLEARSPEFKAAMDIYRKYEPEFENIKTTRSGIVAGWNEGKSTKSRADDPITPQGFADLLLPNNALITPKQIKGFFDTLRRGDDSIIDKIHRSLGEDGLAQGTAKPGADELIRRLVAEMLAARMQEAFNKPNTLQGAREYSRVKYFPEDKQAAVKQLLREAAQSSGQDPDGLVNGFHRLMEVFSAAAESPAIGSPTTGRGASALEAAQSTSGAKVASFADVATPGSKNFLFSRFSAASLEGGRRAVYQALGEILTRPDGLEILKGLATKSGSGGANAKLAARAVISMINEVQADAREEKRSLRGTE